MTNGLPGPSPSAAPFGPDYTPYQAIGGEASVRTLVDTFYDRMDDDEQFALIRGLHPADLAGSRTKLFEFLSGWLGGPPLYVERHGHPRLRGRHMPFPISESERDAWLSCMRIAMDECNIHGDLRVFLDARFAHVANFMRNQ